MNHNLFFFAGCSLKASFFLFLEPQSNLCYFPNDLQTLAPAPQHRHRVCSMEGGWQMQHLGNLWTDTLAEMENKPWSWYLTGGNPICFLCVLLEITFRPINTD